MQYIKFCHPLLFFLFNIFYILVQIVSVCTILWLNDWTAENERQPNSNNNPTKTFRLFIFILLGFAQCVFSFLGESFNTLMFVRAVKQMHSTLLNSILRSSMKFFESTPSGRIMNRFSKDFETLEEPIPERLKDLTFCIYNFVATIVVMSLATPIVLLVFVPVFAIYFIIQRIYIPSSRQLKRLDSSTKSPIFSHFNETIAGVTSIRAYKTDKRFINRMQHLIDENLVYFYPNFLSQRWLSIRVDFLGNSITLFACLFAILSRDTLSAGIVGVSVLYSLNIANSLSWFVRYSSEFETNITSVERINEYCNTPHEAEWSIEETKPPKVWPDQGHIQFKNYSLKYRDDLDYALKDLNINIVSGEKIGIVGKLKNDLSFLNT